MHRIDGDDTAASLPAAAAAGSAGYFAAEAVSPATQVTGDWLNAVQEEIVAVAILKGASLSKASNGQMATALEHAVKTIVGTSSEGSGLDTIWRHAAIACDDAEIGEASGGVVHTLVAASNDCKAKGFESAVIASKTSRAGTTGGTSIACAVIASEKGATEGDNSFVAATKCTDTNPTTVTGNQSAMLAVQVADDAKGVTGEGSAAIATVDPLLDGDHSAIVGGDGHTVSASYAAAVGGTDNTVAATGGVALGGTTNTIASTAGYGVAIGGNDNNVAKTGGAIIAGHNSTIPNPSSAGSYVTLIGSRYCDASLGTAAPAYSVGGGYDAGTTLVNRSWACESNGGNMRSDSAHTTSGLDYAEMFANGDKTPHGAGKLIALRSDKACIAAPGEPMLGVVSAHPSIVGGDDTLGWRGIYERDEFGGYVWQDAEQVDMVDGVEVRTPVRVRARNPAYDPERTHAPRSERPEEHTCVGLLGQLRVRVDADVKAGAMLMPGLNGHGTEATREYLLGAVVDGGARVKCMRVEVPFDAAKGYAVALCLVR
jgi:hypothetical protein